MSSLCLISVFSPHIINEYINQLEILKKNIKKSQELIDKMKKFKNEWKLNINVNIDYSNSWLLHYIGVYNDEIEKDYKKAIEWYTRSAELDNII